jgi:hypothetical protein
MRVGGQGHAPAALPTGQRPGSHFYRRLVGHRGRSERVPGKRCRVGGRVVSFHVIRYKRK